MLIETVSNSRRGESPHHNINHVTFILTISLLEISSDGNGRGSGRGRVTLVTNEKGSTPGGVVEGKGSTLVKSGMLYNYYYSLQPFPPPSPHLYRTNIPL